MPLEREENTYRREIGRLLAEGHAGRHVLIKGDEVISIWDSQREAIQAGRQKFGLEDIAVVKIDERDPERLRLIDSPKIAQVNREVTMPLQREFDTYRRELERLLAEGHAGRHVLIKGDEIVSIWDTQRDALQAACEKYGLEPFAVVKIDRRDPERIRAIDAGKVSNPCQA